MESSPGGTSCSCNICSVVRASAYVRDLELRPTGRLRRIATGFLLGGLAVGYSARLLHSGFSGLYHVSDELADEIARELRYRALLRMALQRKAYESLPETGGVSCHGIFLGRIGDKSGTAASDAISLHTMKLLNR